MTLMRWSISSISPTKWKKITWASIIPKPVRFCLQAKQDICIHWACKTINTGTVNCTEGQKKKKKVILTIK